MKNLILVLALVMGFGGYAEAAAVKNYKKIGQTFAGKIETVEVVYDSSKDAKSAAAIDIAEATADIVILRVIAKVEDGVTASGSATVELGRSGATAALMAQTGKASLGTGVVVDSKVGGYKLAKGTKIIQTIGTDALTAGRIRYLIEYTGF